jgi:hypothetical protein
LARGDDRGACRQASVGAFGMTTVSAGCC